MRVKILTIIAIGISACAAVWAQQPPDVPPPPQAPTRVDAKKQVTVNWSIGDQAWDFKDILNVYEPVKGYIEIQGGDLRPKAVWNLRLIKDLEPGTVNLHQNAPGSPFKVTLLDEDRVVINPQPLPVELAQITPISGKAGDTVVMAVVLPAAPLFNDVKLVRVERRTNVGF